MNTEEMNSVNFWNEIHKSSFCSRDAIICDDWLNRYADIINACNSPILDLGCGSGNDTKYFIEKDNISALATEISNIGEEEESDWTRNPL